MKEPELSATVKVSQLHNLSFIATIGWICGSLNGASTPVVTGDVDIREEKQC